MSTAQQIAAVLNAHHMKTCGGFYGAAGGRFFQARAIGETLEVSPDFGETWIVPKVLAFKDHNGRAINIADLTSPSEGAMVALRDVKKGDYVRRKEGAKTTYIRGDYDKATKTYSLIDCDDASREIFLKPGTLVHVGFTY